MQEDERLYLQFRLKGYSPKYAAWTTLWMLNVSSPGMLRAMEALIARMEPKGS